VIFDLDGTLLDTEPLYTTAANTIVSRYGKVYDWSIKRHTVGGDPMAGARFVVERLDLPLSPEDYLVEREAMMAELCRTAPARAGAERLVRSLHARGIPLAIGTSSGRALCEVKLGSQDFFSCFRAVVCSDDPGIRGGKPSPDIFLKAARELGASPASCLVFEDTEKGVEAALTAGMQVIVTPDPQMIDGDYRGAVVLPSLELLSLEMLGL
jgi:pseudouridine-5'-monophosphatase